MILSPAALLFERIGVFSAIGRSFELVQGRYWSIVLLVARDLPRVPGASGSCSAGILGAVAGAAGSEDETAGAIVSFLSNTALTAVTTPLFAAIVTVLYFDQRVRKEGFDLQLLAEGMGEQPAFTGAPQPAAAASRSRRSRRPSPHPAARRAGSRRRARTPPPGSPGDP